MKWPNAELFSVILFYFVLNKYGVIRQLAEAVTLNLDKTRQHVDKRLTGKQGYH
jgi:hypothetical protein